MAKKLKIGEIAKKAGVAVGTIRYYESIGLIPEPSRTSAGYRIYDAERVTTILFIKEAQRMGFSLEEIGELLYLAEQEKDMGPGEDLCQEVQELAKSKIQEIQNKIESLKELKISLEGLLQKCYGKKAQQKCPIIQSLRHQKD